MNILRRLDELGLPAVVPILVIALLLAAIGYVVADEDVPASTPVASASLPAYRALVCDDLDDTLLTPEEARESCVAVAGRLTRRPVEEGELLTDDVLTVEVEPELVAGRLPVPLLVDSPVAGLEPGTLVTLVVSGTRGTDEPLLLNRVVLLDVADDDEEPVVTLALSPGQREELAGRLATSEVRVWPAEAAPAPSTP